MVFIAGLFLGLVLGVAFMVWIQETGK